MLSLSFQIAPRTPIFLHNSFLCKAELGQGLAQAVIPLGVVKRDLVWYVILPYWAQNSQIFQHRYFRSFRSTLNLTITQPWETENLED
jgi:hypothetical protein